MKNTKEKTGLFKIKPAARHILTIGKDLIKDNATAILELVKNSYDADATKVKISLSVDAKNNQIIIKIKDNGCGMSYETVTDVWMVPSTFYKQNRLFSDKKRRSLQGRKGIGRYASSILGNNFYLKTIKDGEETTLNINWNDFQNKRFLDEIEIPITNNKSKEKNGTYIEIIGEKKELLNWDEKQIENLLVSLKRLISPMHEKDVWSDFQIKIDFQEFPIDDYKNNSFIIEPYPFLEVFDYRISGDISGNGEAKLLFENASTGIKTEEIYIKKIELEDGADYCGKLKIDFKVYDRDLESIDNLIKRLNKITGNLKNDGPLTKNSVRDILNNITGIAVYRNGFRIRPHGDPGYDWLELDRRRVQKPGTRFGSDRVSGFIEIESEEKSLLEEKSNREGLKENKSFSGLVQIAKRILLEAENRRRQFKIKTGKEDSQRNLAEKLDNVFDFSDVTESIQNKLANFSVPEKERQQIVDLIDVKVEESNRIIEDVKRIIAIYQGQATLGKIVKVVLHEGRNPLNFFKQQLPILEMWIAKLKVDYDKDLLEKIINRLNLTKSQAELLVSLFNKISPLAARRKSASSRLNLKKCLVDIVNIFSSELDDKKIKATIDVDENVFVDAWPEDINHAFINLIDNSIYWVSQNKNKTRNIKITGIVEKNIFRLSYKDSGPGIEEKFIVDEMIFEPGFTTKINGTGLGLSIAGEAMERSGGKLSAIYSESGAYFEVDLILNKNEL